jgi:beta-N-acetylhexosaminidase
MLGPLVVDIEGTQLSDAERRRLRHPLVGMVILFARNYVSSEQLRALTAEIHGLRSPPLLIAVDHEGGRVQRFRQPPFTPIAPMMRLGALWDTDVLRACRAALATGYVLAAELRAHGVDLSFAPVLDLDWGQSSVIGDRALHRDARVVAVLAAQLMHGMSLAGMGNCGKHFPGHGWPAADSHTAVPVDERGRAELLAADVAPYRWLGVALAGVMPAHVIYPRVDDRPAGFSSRWIKGVLRRQLGFTGAVFSDDLSMEGARVAGDIVARGQAALDAGCDFILACNDPASVEALLARIRWRRTAAFERRRARVAPRGAAAAMADLLRDPTYLAAREEVVALNTAVTSRA